MANPIPCSADALHGRCARCSNAGASEDARERRRVDAWLEWSGCLFGLGGAALFALNLPGVTAFGWVAYSLANVAMVALGVRIRRYGLLVQQCGFAVISAVGLVRADFPPSVAMVLRHAVANFAPGTAV